MQISQGEDKMTSKWTVKFADGGYTVLDTNELINYLINQNDLRSEIVRIEKVNL